jgi:hypothetical protein
MQQQQKRFGYQPSQKPQKLLALAFALTAAAAIFMGFVIGDDPVVLDLLVAITIKPPYNRLFLWAVGLVFASFAGTARKQAKAQQGKRFELVLSEDALLMCDPTTQATEQVLFPYSNVRSLRVREKGQGRWLEIHLLSGTFSIGASGSVLASTDMDSLEEFDALVAQLREKVSSDQE